MPVDPAIRAEYWARRLTAMPSVTGSPDEAAFGDRLATLLRAEPAWQTSRASVATIPVPGGAFPRKLVFALIRGSGVRTVILTGHYDVVETGNFGPLEHLAFDPDALLPALLETLAAEPPGPANELALADLRSGRFLPGRGLLDMKAGLAAALAAMEVFADAPAPIGNLLFIAVPDEEANSAGARAAALALPDFAALHGLQPVAAINLDAIADDGDGSAGRAVTLGTIGKVLPTALVVGIPAHASYSHRGFGAAGLAATLAAEMEALPELVEHQGDEFTAPPTLLGMKDNRQGYDVTAPESVWMYWNVGLLRRSPADVLAILRRRAEIAGTTYAARLAERHAAAGLAAAVRAVQVFGYAELLDAVEGRLPGTQRALEAEALALPAAMTLPDRARTLTQSLWARSGLAGPAIILGFGSTPYLPVLLDETGPHGDLLRAIRLATSEVSAETGVSIGVRPFFPAISDVSFFGAPPAGGLDTVAANTPMWSAVFGSLASAGLPTINAGPWGRDYHGRTERLETPYAFDTLPRLLGRIARHALMDR